MLAYAKQNSYQLASTVHVEALDNETLAIYNDKYSNTQILDASFGWLIELLKQPNSFADIAKTFSLTYPDYKDDEVKAQVTELLALFEENQLITKSS